MERKTETFVYEGLGFPIKLIDAPMKKVFDEWVLDINMNALQLFVFRSLVHKSSPLTGKEMRFMRKYLELSTTEVAQKLGISHAAIVKWETDKTRISPMQESYLRMFLLECLQETEISSLYKEIRPDKLASESKEQKRPETFSVNAKQLRAAI